MHIQSLPVLNFEIAAISIGLLWKKLLLGNLLKYN